MTPADSIVFLLRHLGPQSTRDLADSLGVSLAELDRTLADLRSSGRIESWAGGKRWRLIPSTAVPTGNPGTR
jgi:hypothetical protein